MFKSIQIPDIIYYMKLKDNLIGQAGFMFIAASLGSLFNLLYNLIAVRFLSAIDYAVLNSILALIMIITTPFGSFATMVAKHSSELSAKLEGEKLKVLLYTLFKHTLIIVFLISLIILLNSYYLASFLKINTVSPVLFLAVIIFFSSPMPVVTGSLQGLQMFYWLGIASIIAGLLKPVLAFFFIGSGFSLLGALNAFFISAIISLILTLPGIRKFFLNIDIKNKINIKETYFYLIPVATTSICLVTLTNIDMVLVKHYFNPIDAGFYSVSQMVGKIVFFLPGPIAFVMFPKTSVLQAQSRESKGLLKKCLIYTSILCLVSVVGYNLFPEIVLKILTGKVSAEYILLGRFFSINMLLFALLNILLTYNLSINNFKFIKNLIFFTILQILMIVLFHKTLTFILFIILINALLLFFINMRLVFRK